MDKTHQTRLLVPTQRSSPYVKTVPVEWVEQRAERSVNSSDDEGSSSFNHHRRVRRRALDDGAAPDGSYSGRRCISVRTSLILTCLLLIGIVLGTAIVVTGPTVMATQLGLRATKGDSSVTASTPPRGNKARDTRSEHPLRPTGGDTSCAACLAPIHVSSHLYSTASTIRKVCYSNIFNADTAEYSTRVLVMVTMAVSECGFENCDMPDPLLLRSPSMRCLFTHSWKKWPQSPVISIHTTDCANAPCACTSSGEGGNEWNLVAVLQSETTENQLSTTAPKLSRIRTEVLSSFTVADARNGTSVVVLNLSINLHSGRQLDLNTMAPATTTDQALPSTVADQVLEDSLALLESTILPQKCCLAWT